MARVMGTVHRIMTVAMKQQKVGNPVVCAVPILMMDFEPIICGKVEVTPPTLTVLSLQELLVLRWQAGIVAEAQAPVGPVPIIGAAGAGDFHMPGDRRGGMLRQRLGLAKDNPPVLALPVSVHPPPIAFVRMAPQSPPAELMMHAVVHHGKDGLRDDVGIVPRPACNDGPEGLDQGLLAGAAIPSDHGARASEVTLLRFPTGFDQRFKAERFAHTILAAAVAAHGILANVKAEKIASHMALVGMQGMGDAGFAGFEAQTDLLEPLCGAVLEYEERVQVAMEDQGVVRVSHHRWLPVDAMLLAWDTATQRFFEPMEGDIGQQRRRGTTLRGPGPGGCEDCPLEDPSFQPAFDETSELRERVELSAPFQK
jgi:hypothetical protein